MSAPGAAAIRCLGAVAALMLAACGAQPSPSSSDAAASPTPAASGTASGATTNPCDLLTTDEVSAVEGTSVKATNVAQVTGSFCQYAPVDNSGIQVDGIVLVGLYSNMTAATWQAAVKQYTQGAAAMPIAGLGDSAFGGQFKASTGTTTYVAVLKGSRGVLVDRAVYVGTAPPIGSVTALARAALSRL